MKTTKLIAATGLFILATLLIGSVTYAGGKINPTDNKTITYVVKVHDSEGLHNGNCFWILLQDPKGNLLGKQVFNPGIFEYIFQELGPVREARYVVLNLNGREIWAKDVNYGPFWGGRSYEFNLFPIK